MYLFFDNVPSNPTAEILKLKLQSPSYPGAARTETGLLIQTNDRNTYISVFANVDGAVLKVSGSVPLSEIQGYILCISIIF